MGTTETHAEACIDVAKQAVDDPAESVAPDGDDGYAESFRIAVNLLRIFENETYRDLEDILAGRPGVRDAFGIEDDEVPDFSTICVWYQSLTIEIWRLLLRLTRSLQASPDTPQLTVRSSNATKQVRTTSTAPTTHSRS